MQATDLNGKQQPIGERTIQVTPPVPITRLSADPPTIELAQGRAQQLRITAIRQDDSTLDVTGNCHYATEDTTVAGADAAGLVSATMIGVTNVVVSYD
ncbi:Ig-like domain-containing protein, partial [Frankia sp. Cpl3]|nr:Ig-like domain-containing protein [Frankia sp. Cpl3]